MFWEKIIPKKFDHKRQICGVEVIFQENTTLFYYTHLKINNGKLAVEETGSSEGKLQLPGTISKAKLPLILVLNGKGIILKKISWGDTEVVEDEQLLMGNLPAINTQEFYCQLTKQNNSTGFIGMVRRDLADSLFKQLHAEKLEIAGVHIGAPTAIASQALWQNYNIIPTSLHTLEITNQCIEAITPVVAEEQKVIQLDTINLNARNFLGFSAGFGYLTRQDITYTNSNELKAFPITHIQNNRFRFLQIVCVALALVLALTNVFFYTHYFNANNKLETELNVYQGKNDEINQLLGDYQKKKDLIENAGVLNKNKLSEYADKIASTLPQEVILSEMHFNPQIQNDEDSLVSFQKNQLIIKGNCNKSLIINEWENVLKMQSFIKEVALEKFSYNSEGILPNFEIRIKIDP